MHGPGQQLPARLEVPAVLRYARKPFGDQAGAVERGSIGLLGPAPRVERLGAVGERVHRGTGALGRRQPQRERLFVDDRHRLRPSPASLDPRLPVTHAEALGPLRARVGRGDRDDRKAGLAGHRLGRVDRTAAAQSHQPIHPLGRGQRLAHPGDVGVRLHAVKAPGDRQLKLAPPRGGDQERPADRQLVEHAGQGVETPANDHPAIKSQPGVWQTTRA